MADEEELRLPVLPMTSGSSGLHAVVPLDRGAAFDEVRAVASDAAGVPAGRHPDRLTTEHRKAGRGRVYLDVQRNAYAQTAVARYAVRALPGAPVAMPLARGELDEPGLTARRWTLVTAASGRGRTRGRTRHAGAGPWGRAAALRRPAVAATGG